MNWSFTLTQKRMEQARWLGKDSVQEETRRATGNAARAVSGGQDLYKIKLRALGYRLVYQVQDNIVTVYVLSVRVRENNQAYKDALSREDDNA